MMPSIASAATISLKVFILLGIILYGMFAMVIVRQEQLMAGVLEESFEPTLRIMALVHMVFVIGLFFLALVIL